MGEAKRRKELGLPPREKPKELELPKLDKGSIQKKLGHFYIKIQLSNFFYDASIAAIAWGVYNLLKFYKLI